MKIVAVTACSVGIAHTYMAAEALEKAAKKRDLEIWVETQGAVGIENKVPDDVLAEADFAIFAVDLGIEKKERFDEKIVFKTIPADAIRRADAIIDEAIAYYKEQTNNA